MLQKEFEERTGLTPTIEEYKQIEAMYMAAGDNVDKDVFCSAYENFSVYQAAVVAGIMNTVKKLKGQYEERCNEIDDLHERMSGLTDFLIGKACACNDTDFYKQAVKMVGIKDVVLRKLKMKLPLWDEDIEYIKENII